MRFSNLFFTICLFINHALHASTARPPQIVLKYSTPGGLDECGQTLMSKIEGTSRHGDTLHVSMYSLSNKTIISELKRFASRGGRVCIIGDSSQFKGAMKERLTKLTNEVSTYDRVKVRLKGQENSNWINSITFHEKLALIEKTIAGSRSRAPVTTNTLMMGSYNWSWRAENKNFENCLFLSKGRNEDINAVFAVAKSRFDEMWRGSTSINTTGSTDAVCLFQRTPAENARMDAELKNEEDKRRRKRALAQRAMRMAVAEARRRNQSNLSTPPRARTSLQQGSPLSPAVQAAARNSARRNQRRSVHSRFISPRRTTPVSTS